MIVSFLGALADIGNSLSTEKAKYINRYSQRFINFRGWELTEIATVDRVLNLKVFGYAYSNQNVLNIFPKEISFSNALFSFSPHLLEQTKNMPSLPSFLASEP